MKILFHAFWHVCAAVLAGTALLKLWMLGHTPGNLAVPDPSLPGFALRDSVAVAIVLELLCAGFLLFGRSGVVKALTLLWWCSLAMIYRAGYPAEADCPCLGNIPSLLGLRPGSGSTVALLLICFFVLGGSVLALLHAWRQGRRRPEAGKKSVIVTWCLFSLVGPSQAGDASEGVKHTKAIRVTGTCQRTGIDWGAMKAHTEAGTFTLTASPSAVEVVVVITNAPLNAHPPVVQYEYRTEGSDSVNIGRFGRNALAQEHVYPVRENGVLTLKTNDAPAQVKNQCHIFLTPWSLPHGYVNVVLPMALAFGWQPAFAKSYSTNEGPSLIDFGRAQRGALDRVRVSIEGSPVADGGGPSSLVTYYADDINTNDAFMATGFKQFAAGRFPTVLRYVHYVQPSLRSKLPAHMLFDWQVSASVISVEECSPPAQDIMRFGSCTGRVEDTRFCVSGKDPVPVLAYLTTNGVLPSRSIVMQKEFFRQETDASRRGQRASRLRLLLLVLLLLAFPITVVVRGKRRRTQQHT